MSLPRFVGMSPTPDAMAAFEAHRARLNPAAAMNPATVHARATGTRQPQKAASASVRAQIAAKVNLPATASDAQILAAVDAVAAERDRFAAVSAEDALYAKYMGTGPSTDPVSLTPTEQELYERAWGAA